jgi:3-dehydroquinate synthase
VDDAIVQRVQLALEYPVVFTRGAFESDNRSLIDVVSRLEPGRRHRIFPVIDGGVAARWPGLADAIAAYVHRHADRLELAGSPEVLAGGEATKTSAVVEQLWTRFADARIDRHSFVLAIGGGAVLDVVGYAAATLHRGVRLVRMPTTVLAQNDAGVGVKNGINAFGAKNFLGTFAAPFAVINDSQFLATLAPRDRIAGMAEAVKVALVRDAQFYRWLVEHADALARFELPQVEQLIRRCAELHLAHIAGGGDPFEQGNARPLDFGHWAAHKLENLTDHAIRHGEAVSIGMVLDSRYSVEAGLLDAATHRQIVDLLVRLGLPIWDDALTSPALLDGLREFQEHLGGELCITLLQAVGRGIESRDIDVELVRRALAWMQHRRAA